MLRDAWAVLKKDLLVEARTKVALWQVLPFAVLALVTFAFALGPSRAALRTAAPGLVWVAVAFASTVVVGRSQALELDHGVRASQRLAGIDPAGVFLGKAGAVAIQLALVELVLGAASVGLLGLHLTSLALAVVSASLATVGLAAVGTLYGALTGAARARETLLPMLVLPVVVPVLIASVRCWQVASGASGHAATWLAVLAVFALVYAAAGVALYGTVEEVQ